MGKRGKNQGKRHTGRLELRGKKWLAIWMVGGKRSSRSTGLEDRAEAEQWLARKLDDVKLADELNRNAANKKKDKAELQERLKTYIKGKIVEIDDELEAISAKLNEHTLRLEDAWAVCIKRLKEKQKASRSKLTVETLDHKQRSYERFVAWCNQKHPECKVLSDVTVSIAKDYVKFIGDDIMPATFNNALAALQQIWTLLSQDAKISENPWTRQNVGRQSSIGSSIRREISDAELLVIFREARNYRPPLEKLFTVLLYTGARLGDAAKLRWESVDLRRGFISFIPQKTKRFRTRVKIPIMSPLRAMLEATPIMSRMGYVMPDMAKYYEAGTLSEIVTHFFKTRCGIKTRRKTDIGKRPHSEVSAHSFRHTFVSLAANAGIPFAIIQKIVGHQTAEMCAHYFHENEEVMLRAFQAFPTLNLNAPQLEDKGGEVIDAEATIIQPTRLDELKRLMKEIVEGGDADELNEAVEAVREIAKAK